MRFIYILSILYSLSYAEIKEYVIGYGEIKQCEKFVNNKSQIHILKPISNWQYINYKGKPNFVLSCKAIFKHYNDYDQVRFYNVDIDNDGIIDRVMETKPSNPRTYAGSLTKVNFNTCESEEIAILEGLRQEESKIVNFMEKTYIVRIESIDKNGSIITPPKDVRIKTTKKKVLDLNTNMCIIQTKFSFQNTCNYKYRRMKEENVTFNMGNCDYYFPDEELK